MLYRMPEKQKELLIALAKEVKTCVVTSGEFVRNYRLSSPSSVQSTLRGLLEKDFITQEQGVYQVYDRFFRNLAEGEFLRFCRCLDVFF